MKKQYLIKSVLFVIIITLLLSAASGILKAKWIDGETCSETYVIGDMYDLEKDSVELAILGSSQLVFGISSMQLLKEQGISAYSTCTSAQPMSCTFFLLKEMVKMQDIHTVVLEISQLYEEETEAAYLKTLHTSKMSLNKLELIKSASKGKSWTKFWSYVFPLMQYHSRWNEITETDFVYREENTHVFRGNILSDYIYYANYDKLIIDNDEMDDTIQMVKNQENYCRKIIEYCQEQGINIVLMKTPKTSWDITRNQGVQKLANEYGVDYIDFNTAEMIEKLGMDFKTDFMDPDHTNVRGTEKVTAFMGEYLKKNYEFEDARLAPSYDEALMKEYQEEYERNYAQIDINRTIYEFLKSLKAKNYEIIIQKSGDASVGWNYALNNAMKRLGATVSFSELENQNYIAHFSNGIVFHEEVSVSTLDYKGRFSDGVEFSLVSRISKNPKMTVGTERIAFGKSGLNIIAYDRSAGSIVKSFSLYYDGSSSGMLMQEGTVELK